jgi:hypothetical protein
MPLHSRGGACPCRVQAHQRPSWFFRGIQGKLAASASRQRELAQANPVNRVSSPNRFALGRPLIRSRHKREPRTQGLVSLEQPGAKLRGRDSKKVALHLRRCAAAF